MTKPPILNFATPQRKDEGIIYTYDEALNLNVVNTTAGIKKFIDMADAVEFATKTDVERERDDVCPEFSTKTRIEREGDDTHRGYHLSEFATKTAVQRESDDQPRALLLEFVTTTKVERETTD